MARSGSSRDQLMSTSSGGRPALMIVGMDVHRNRTQVCVVDGEGKEVRNRNVVNRPQGPSQGTVGAAQGDQGGRRGGVWRGLGGRAMPGPRPGRPHLAHASGCRAIADAKLKYDRPMPHPGQPAADGLSGRGVAGIREVREQRLLLRERAWLVRLRAAAKNRIRAHLADEGIPVGVRFMDPGRRGGGELRSVHHARHRCVVTALIGGGRDSYP